MDAREHETGLHSQRVACHIQVLARRYTQDPQRLHQIYWGALLHDLGKVGIPDAILLNQWESMPDGIPDGEVVCTLIESLDEDCFRC